MEMTSEGERFAHGVLSRELVTTEMLLQQLRDDRDSEQASLIKRLLTPVIETLDS